MAVSFSDEPMAFNTGGQASDVTAAIAALGACERARLTFGSDRPCEIHRLNDSLASGSADIKAGVEAPHPLFMWRYENGSTRLYLVGSIHVLKAALLPLPKRIEAAFSQADHVVVEADVMNADAAAIAQTFRKYALPPRRHSNRGKLERGTTRSPERRIATTRYWSCRCRTVQTHLSCLAAQRGRLTTFGYLPNYGIEAHFLSRLGDRTLHELETVEQQLALLASPPMADQVESW